MSDKFLTLRIQANIADFKKQMAEVTKATEEFGKTGKESGKRSSEGMDEARKAATQVRDALLTAGRAAQTTAKEFGLAYDSTGQLRDKFGNLVTEAKAATFGLEAASAATKEFAAEQAVAAAQAAAATTATGATVKSAAEHGEAWTKVGTALLGFGVAAVAGVGLAVHAWSDFSAKMSQVQTLSHANGDDMKALSQEALTAGQNIGISATEVADAEIELVKAGANVKDIMGGALVGALNLASAGQIEVGKATEIATIAMTQFNLHGQDIPHVADLLAAGADKALGGVEDLGMGLKQGGLVAAQFGLTIDDTVGTLSAFANAGLLGSDAGTSMKTMFLALASPSKQAQDELNKYNITAYDSQGKFKGVTELAGQLHDKLGGLSDAQRNAALSTIFGTDAMRSASVLMKEGRDGIAGWIKDVNDQGFAAQQAAGKMNNLNGDMNKLAAAFQTGLIQMGSASDSFLRPVIQNVTGVVRAFDALPEPVKGAGLAAAAAAGGVALLIGGFLTLAPKVLDTINGFSQLKESAPGVTSALGRIGKAATVAAGSYTAATAVIAAFNSAARAGDNQTSVEKFINGISGADAKQAIKNIDGMFNGVLKTGDSSMFRQVNSLDDALNRVFHTTANENISDFFGTLSLQNASTGINVTKKAFDNLDQALASLTQSGSLKDAQTGFAQIKARAEATHTPIDQLIKQFPQYQDAIVKIATANGQTSMTQDQLNKIMDGTDASFKQAAAATQTFTDATGATVPVTDDVAKQLEKIGVTAQGTINDLNTFTQVLLNSGLVTLSAREAEDAFQTALDGVDQKVQDVINSQAKLGGALNKNRTDFDSTTQSGRDADAMFNDLARKGMGSAQAMAANGDALPKVAGKLNETRNALIGTAEKFGLSHDAAVKLTDGILHVPKGVSVQSWMSDMAKKMAEQTTGAINNIPKHVEITTTATTFHNLIESVQKASDAANNIAPADGSYGRGLGVLKRASGGPVFGPGTGTSDDVPAWLSNGEHVLTADEVQKLGGQAAVYRFRDMVDKGQLPKFATGGAVYNDPGHLGESATAHANRLYREAQARAKAEAAAYKKVAGDREQYIRDARRGETYATVTGSLSGAYSYVDRLNSLANSGNLTGSTAGYLRTAAGQGEAALRRLYTQSDKLTVSLTNAKQKLTDLTQVKDNIATSLSGEFSLGDAIQRSRLMGGGVAGIQGAASGFLTQVQTFAAKLQKLQRMGYSGAILQEVSAMGTTDGNRAADALLAATGAQVKGLNSTYTAIDAASNNAGAYVTDAMYKGGVNAAAGLVKGLESQQAVIEKQMLKIGLSMESALKRSLGIRSPSRKAQAIAHNFGGTIADTLDLWRKPIGAKSAELGDAMDITPSKSLAGAYRAPGMTSARSTGGMGAPQTITVNNYITGQSHPVVTAHEVQRRFANLRP